MNTYPFQTAIIDPPWPYDRASKNEKLSGYVSQDGNEKYKTLSIDDLKQLPVGDVVGGYIFLWTVSPFLKEGIELLERWGFRYVTSLAWFKNTGLGVGYWFRGSHELVLVAKREGVKSVRTGEQSIFQSKRTRHSAKPDNVHAIAEKHFPGPYLEVFGREARDGWTILGNQAPGDGLDIRDSIRQFIKDESNEVIRMEEHEIPRPETLARSSEPVSPAAG